MKHRRNKKQLQLTVGFNKHCFTRPQSLTYLLNQLHYHLQTQSLSWCCNFQGLHMSQPTASDKTGKLSHLGPSTSHRSVNSSFGRRPGHRPCQYTLGRSVDACQHVLCRTCPWLDIGEAHVDSVFQLDCNPQNHSPMEVWQNRECSAYSGKLPLHRISASRHMCTLLGLAEACQSRSWLCRCQECYLRPLCLLQQQTKCIIRKRIHGKAISLA